MDAPELVDYVGHPPFTNDKIYETTPPGVVMGLAYTSLGGSSLYIEAAAVEKGRNKGSLRTTGGLPILQKRHIKIFKLHWIPLSQSKESLEDVQRWMNTFIRPGDLAAYL